MPLASPSLMSYLVEAFSAENSLGIATAFMVRHGEFVALATNWHVASGRDYQTGQPTHKSAATPDRLVFRAAIAGAEGRLWAEVTVPLIDSDGSPMWLEHPSYLRRVDAVLLPMTDKWVVHGGQAAAPPYELHLPPMVMPGVGDPPDDDTLQAGVSSPVSIIGFPFGRTGGLGYLPVWVAGTIATELDVDFDGRPCFLIDARTRRGQSGSPVVVYSAGGPAASQWGAMFIGGGPITRLLGIYSGRIGDDSDLGFVWSVQALLDIATRGVRGNGTIADPRLAPGAYV
jgi:hypothetical protein